MLVFNSTNTIPSQIILGRRGNRDLEPLLPRYEPVAQRDHNDGSHERSRVVHVASCNWKDRRERQEGQNIENVGQGEHIDRKPVAAKFEWSVLRMPVLQFPDYEEEDWDEVGYVQRNCW